MIKNNEIVIFEADDKSVSLPVPIENETVWLSANQMAQLFDRDEKTIRKHINNVFSEEEVEKNNNTQKMRVVGVKQLVPFYTLDVIISVGYRVKSKRGVEFRRWANSVLKQYILKGYAVNDNRIKQLGEVIRIMKRTEDSLDSKQVLSVIEKYSVALDLLDYYDHQNMTRPRGNEATYILNYDECMKVIKNMRFGNESDVFGKEKDDSFKGSIGNIYQSFDGVDVYESLEEKAANLLYFVTKNHSFIDGNKRIAATMFLYFLDKNLALFIDGKKKLEDATLVALTNTVWCEAQLLEQGEGEKEQALHLYRTLASRIENGENMEDASKLYFHLLCLESEHLDARKTEDRAQMLELAEKGLMHNKNDFSCLDYQAWILKCDGQREKALALYHQLETVPRYFLRLQEMNPDGIDGYNGMSYLYDAMKRYEESLEQINKVIARIENTEGNQSSYYYHKARILRRLNRSLEAIDVIDELTKKYGNDDVFREKFDISCQFGLWEQADQILKEWANSGSNEKELYAAKIDFDLFIGKTDEARTALTKTADNMNVGDVERLSLLLGELDGDETVQMSILEKMRKNAMIRHMN